MTTRVRTLGGLVHRLHREHSRAIAAEPIAELLSRARFSAGTVEPYLRFESKGYTRNLVHRTPLFDVIILCWQPGQRTPIHDHSGQLGWVRVLRGQIEETTYRFNDDPRVEAGAPVGRLQEVTRAVVEAGTDVASIDPFRAIHRIENPVRAAEPAVTLHVYSRPHDSCLVYDLEANTARLRRLVFHNTGDCACT